MGTTGIFWGANLVEMSILFFPWYSMIFFARNAWFMAGQTPGDVQETFARIFRVKKGCFDIFQVSTLRVEVLEYVEISILICGQLRVKEMFIKFLSSAFRNLRLVLLAFARPEGLCESESVFFSWSTCSAPTWSIPERRPDPPHKEDGTGWYLSQRVGSFFGFVEQLHSSNRQCLDVFAKFSKYVCFEGNVIPVLGTKILALWS